MKISEIMTNTVSAVSPNSTIKEAASIMKELNVGSVPVCEGKRPIGIITDRDIVIRNVANAGDVNTPVSQVMSQNIVYGNPNMSDQEAADLMSARQVRRLPIIENENIVGIVALGDLAVNHGTDLEAGQALTDISVPSKPQ